MTDSAPCQPLHIDMSPIPDVPYGHGTPVSDPGHLECDEAVLLIKAHAVAVHCHLLAVLSCPSLEALCGVCTLEHDDVHGFRATELRDRHLV